MKADVIFHNGEVITLDGASSAREIRARDSIAVKDGRVIFPEDGKSWKSLEGFTTETVNLHGCAVIPGLADCHIHPLWGARTLSGPSLAYEPLSLERTIEAIRAFLDEDAGAGP
ncbi:MAG: amidohydrolase, partial [Deltaproteobacteria bacterium]|nr:amidohydrolase [Deltaproteobacteria bacterium]